MDLRLDSDYTGRVEYDTWIDGYRTHCRLRISDLRESDSAVYKFRFITNQPGGESSGEPGVSLTVTDLQVKMIRSSTYQSSIWAELKCHTLCRLTGHSSYIWYKNGEQKGFSSSYKDYIYPEDSYSCAVRGRERFRSPSVYAPKVPSVSVRPSGEIEEGSSVTLTCSSDANPAATYTWYKKNGNPDQEALRTGPQLNFVSIQSSDSGEFYCTAQNELGENTSDSTSIDVKYAPKVPSVSVSPSGEIVEGSSVTLTCSSDANPAATYTWYKKNGNPDQEPFRTGPQLDFVSIQSSDSGEFYCTVQNELGAKRSYCISLDVKCE
ncbi:B-cell receptor CD22-like [Myripristis murdjan]|uniref:B-cell receptor CD22-like n=1 Tax=Myripristis murdjan TaxID=586833 RepID=UPI001175F70B|nr:B-cell receptor CD22-like [Myripristis murdjan]